MLKIFLAAMLVCIASLAAPSAALANYRHMDHSTTHHHPHSRGHNHHEWRRR